MGLSQSKDPNGAVVLITGCSEGGIGYALAEYVEDLELHDEAGCIVERFMHCLEIGWKPTSASTRCFPPFMISPYVRHCRREFATRGCTVHATSRRLATMEGLKAKGIHTLEMDVTSPPSIEVRWSKKIK